MGCCFWIGSKVDYRSWHCFFQQLSVTAKSYFLYCSCLGSSGIQLSKNRISFIFTLFFFFFCLNFKTCKSHHCYIYKLGFLFLLVIFLGKLIRGKLGSELSGKYNELKTWKNVNVNIL